jgi:hypothetical protein
MAFSMTSFFAGVGTVLAALTIGFAGGTMINSSPKLEPDRLERVAANDPPVTSAAVKVESPAVHLAPTARAETTETAPAPDRVIAMTPPSSSSQQTAPPPPQPVMAKDDSASQIDSATKVSESELRKPKENVSHRAERRARARLERRERQEIQAAANAARKLQRDGILQDLSQRDDSPRLGFFGNN